jgi:CRP-like cAMP-binding protein
MIRPCASCSRSRAWRSSPRATSTISPRWPRWPASRPYRAGETIYAEGDPGDALYVIIDGAVEARRDNEVVLTMHARESFGETSLFDGTPRINSVVTLAETRVLVIDRRDFLDLLGDRPELLTGMFRLLSRQLKSMVVEVAARRATTGEMPALSFDSAARK